MRVSSFPRSFARLALLVGVLAAPAVAGADAVVLRVVGPASVRPGDELRSRTRFWVGRNAVLTALRDDQVVIVVTGPFSGVFGSRSTSRGRAFLSRLRGTFGLQGLILAATMRSGQSQSPDIRLLDLTAGGTKCIFPGGPATLWAPAPAATIVFTLAMDGRPGVELPWSRGRSELAWPAQVRLADSADYVAQVGDADPVRFRIRLARAPLTSMPEQMIWLAEMGCVDQLELAVANLPILHLGPSAQ